MGKTMLSTKVISMRSRICRERIAMSLLLVGPWDTTRSGTIETCATGKTGATYGGDDDEVVIDGEVAGRSPPTNDPCRDQ